MKCNYCCWFSGTYCSCPFYDKKEFCNKAELKEENENLILADIEEVLQDKIKENMENDSRVVKVTLQQAKEWYYSGNKALQEIALSAYTEEELVFTLDTAVENTPINTISLIVPIHKENQIREYIKLSILAEYFNKGWKKNLGNTGYFIGVSKSFTPNKLLKKIDENKSIGVIEHISVAYPEIIYFKNKEDLIRASKLINLEKYIG